MKKYLLIIILVGFSFILPGCFVSQQAYQLIQSENIKLKGLNESLQTEIQELKNTPNYYFQNGIKYKDKNNIKSFEFFKTLNLKFPKNKYKQEAIEYIKIFQKENYELIIKTLNNANSSEEKLKTIDGMLIGYKDYITKENYNNLEKKRSDIEALVEKEKLAQNSTADEILKLSKLKDDGIISEEEFEAKKKKLLDL